MQRYIFTGAPSAGKTTLIEALAARGHCVVAEAATEVNSLMLARGVANPSNEPDFIDAIVDLQRRRRMEARAEGLQFHDRSVVCTHALAEFLGLPISRLLAAEMERVARDKIYQRRVFFFDNLGFVTSTPVRRISFEDTLKFEAVHERVYRRFGYELVRVAPASVAERVKFIEGKV